MIIRKLNDCEEIIAGDGCTLREILHADKGDFTFQYSLAYAVVAPGERTKSHSLKYSEVYYILEGKGTVYIDGEPREVNKTDTVYIPPGAIQFIENSVEEELKFLCIVDPAWKSECEIVSE